MAQDERVLLSIKPEYVERIFDGTKIYEFRKKIWKRPQIQTIVVYSSKPIKRVVGQFDIDTILIDSPARLWEQTYSRAGITQDLFFTYFHNKKIGYAIKIKNPVVYKKPLYLHSKPPQSFYYISSQTL